MKQPVMPAPEAMTRDRSLDEIAAALERTNDFRVLRRLRPHDEFTRGIPDRDTKIGLVLDVETTGLDTDRDEVIELGMLRFAYLPDGRVGRVLGEFAAFNEPSVPVKQEITDLTGITNEMLVGQKIDPVAVASFVSDVAIVIAHNARFDRPFAARHWPLFRDMAWACSATQVEWRRNAFQGARLVHLLAGIGLFHDAHRAVDDCRALLEVLAFRPDGQVEPFLANLLTAARRKTTRIWAEHSPFERKDELKKRGYRWSDGADGRPKSWFVDVDAAAADAELRFLRTEIFGRDVDLRTDEITAFTRFSTRS
jgi:DNA polymerase-3 subunit epsilon